MNQILVRFLFLIGMGSSLLTSCIAAPSQNKPTVTVAPTAKVRLSISGSEDVTAVLEASATSFHTSFLTHRLKILSGSGVEPSTRGVLEGVLDGAAMNRLPTAD